MSQEQWVAVVGAIVTAVGGIVAAVTKKKSGSSEVEVAQINADQETEGRLWTRIVELEARLAELELEKAECREELASARARITILERRFASITPPAPVEAVDASP
tara:strand:+ start:371 stop:685 length:315 start_codon:yes stop_codon:yes gene_type:complete